MGAQQRGRTRRPLRFVCSVERLLRRALRLEFGRGFGGAGLRGALAFLQDQLVAVRRHLADAGDHAARARRDQAPDDDVLLEALQRIDLALDRRFREDARRLLERGRREERARL